MIHFNLAGALYNNIVIPMLDGTGWNYFSHVAHRAVKGIFDPLKADISTELDEKLTNQLKKDLENE